MPACFLDIFPALLLILHVIGAATAGGSAGPSGGPPRSCPLSSSVVEASLPHERYLPSMCSAGRAGSAPHLHQEDKGLWGRSCPMACILPCWIFLPSASPCLSRHTTDQQDVRALDLSHVPSLHTLPLIHPGCIVAPTVPKADLLPVPLLQVYRSGGPVRVSQAPAGRG